MKLDLFLEFASPPGARRSLAEVMEDGLAIVRAADQLGFDAAWVAEHHFLGDYCNAAAPDMLLAAALKMIQDHKVGALVVEEDGQAVGVIHVLDMLRIGAA